MRPRMRATCSGARVLEAGDRHVRLEGARLGRQARRSRRALIGARERLELGARLDAGPQRARLVAAEHAEAGEAHLEGVDGDRGEPVGELRRLLVGDVAGKAQRQVQVLRLEPLAVSRQRLAQTPELLALLVGDLDACEQARH